MKFREVGGRYDGPALEKKCWSFGRRAEFLKRV